MKVSTKLLLTMVVAVASTNGAHAASLLKRVAKLTGYATVGTAAYYHPTLLGYVAQAKKEYTPAFVSSFLEKRQNARYAALKEQYPHAKGTPAEIDAVTGRVSCKEMRAVAKNAYHSFVNDVTNIPQVIGAQGQKRYNQAVLFAQQKRNSVQSSVQNSYNNFSNFVNNMPQSLYTKATTLGHRSVVVAKKHYEVAKKWIKG
jgi:predicted sugar kinase